MKPLHLRHLRSACVAVLAVAGLAGSAPATVLTFEMEPRGFRSMQAQHPWYGDRVTSTSGATDGFTYEYLEGDGFTPNVVVDYSHHAPDGNNSLGQYHYDNELNWSDDVDYLHAFDGATFWITLTPDSGYGVNLDSFIIDLYVNGPSPDGLTFNWKARQDGTSGAILAQGQLTGITTANDPLVTVDASYAGPIVLEMSYLNAGTVGIVGIDDVSFTQFAVPEPAAAGALIAGGAAVLGRRRQRA